MQITSVSPTRWAGSSRWSLPRPTFIAAIILVGIFAGRGDVEAQCAMCRTVLNSPEGQQMVAALRSGILLLLAAPFAIFATIAVLAVRGQRRRMAAEGGRDE
jgi:hypothetical protein